MIIDETQLGGLAEAAGVDTVRTILDAFWDSTEHLATGLVEAIQSGDANEAKQLAHALKGSAANVGAAALAETARSIESSAKDDRLMDAAEDLGELVQRIAETRAEMEQLLVRYADPSLSPAAQA